MFAYLVELEGGPSLEQTVKNYKQAVKSHRRISVNQGVNIVSLFV